MVVFPAGKSFPFGVPVTIGERTMGSKKKREVYIQEFNSSIQRLEQPVGSTLVIKSWREVYRIIKYPR